MRITRDHLLALDPEQFEMLVAGLMEEAGFENVLAFGGSGDEGVDLRAEWSEELPTGGSRQTIWAVQCKRYSRAVSETEVREILSSMIEPPRDLFPKHPDFFLIATASRLSVPGQKVLNRANAMPAKYGCHFVVWNGERILALLSDSERLAERFFQLREAPTPFETVSRLQVVLDQFDEHAVLTFTFEANQCVMGRTRLSANELQRLTAAFRYLPSWSPGNAEAVRSEVNRLGTELFGLIPDSVRAALRQRPGLLRITSNVHVLPFELALDPDSSQFVGSTHAVGRIHFANTLGQPDAWHNPAVVYISPLYASSLALPAAEEASALFSGLPANTPVHSLVGPDATIAAASSLLSSIGSSQILHFSGHGYSTEADDVTLLMSDGLLPATDVLRRLRSASVVFLNACSSGPAFNKLSHAMMDANGSALVGFVGPVTDQGGAIIATEFYEQALAGVPLGRAVQSAREKQKITLPNDFSWVSCVLFGDPAATITIRAR